MQSPCPAARCYVCRFRHLTTQPCALQRCIRRARTDRFLSAPCMDATTVNPAPGQHPASTPDGPQTGNFSAMHPTLGEAFATSRDLGTVLYLPLIAFPTFQIIPAHLHTFSRRKTRSPVIPSPQTSDRQSRNRPQQLGRSDPEIATLGTSTFHNGRRKGFAHNGGARDGV